MSIDLLEPRIRQIILSTPKELLSSITAKDVRARLLEDDPNISEGWIKANKKPINQLIANVFEAVSGALALEVAPVTGEEAPPPYRKKEEEDGKELFGSYDGRDDDDTEMDGPDDGGPSTPPQKAKKSKTKRELTDEEYARQLASELNGSSRASRSGKAPNGRSSKKGASRTPKKSKKSAEHIDDSDASDGEVDDSKKRKKKRASAEGGGAKGGFKKEFILSAPLSALLEVDRLSRPQVVKQLWVYIKANDLQNPSNKREIICDDRLRPVFRTDKIDMFAMNKVLGQHLHEEE